MFVQFQTLDALQHRLWHLLGLNSDVPAPDNWVAVCRRALATLDACLGELCELAERRRAVIVAVSDHGFGPFRGGINLPELLRRRDLLAHPGLGSRIGYRVRRQFWKIGRSLWRRSRAGAKTAALSRPLEALLPIDWRRSRAMALHGNMGALIYVNSSARFGSDLVKNPRQYDQVVDESIAALVEARHPETGEALFTDAYSVASRYGQDPVRAASPDVIGIAAPGFHTRTKLSTSRSLILEDANMTGTHRREGVLMIGSPAGPVGAPIQAQLRDVAPTLAHLLGIAPMTPMTGRVIEAAFQPAAPVRQLL